MKNIVVKMNGYEATIRIADISLIEKNGNEISLIVGGKHKNYIFAKNEEAENLYSKIKSEM